MVNYEIAETGTSEQIRKMVAGWHPSNFGIIQMEVAKNPNADAELLRLIFEKGQNEIADLEAANHKNCPPDLRDKLTRRSKNYIPYE